MKKRFLVLMCALTMIIAFSMNNIVNAEEGIKPELEQGDSVNTEKIDISKENSGYSLVLEQETYTYTGTEHGPDVELRYQIEGAETYEVVDSENYEVTYSDNINASHGEVSGKVTVTGKEEKGYTGSLSGTFIIEAKSVKDLDVTLSKTVYLYDGKEKVPTVKVKYGDIVLKKEIDYDVSYKENVNVGTSTVVIIGKGNYTGETCKTYKIEAFGKIPSLITTPSNNKIKVSWKKIDGADGYLVYRRTAGESYKRIAAITKGSTLSYSDTSIEMGTTYYYKIRAYKKVAGKMILSSYSSERKQRAQVAKVAEVNAFGYTYNSVKIVWEKVSGATKYGIYRSTSANGTYSRIGTVKAGAKLEFVDKNLSCGKWYYYKVAAYQKVQGSYCYGYKSDYDAARPFPSKANFTSSTKPYTTSVKLVWSKSLGAKGYEIYRDSGNGYSRVKTITSGSTTSWTDTSLKKGTEYRYKIRPYTIVNGKKVFGNYSSVYTRKKAGWRYVNGYKLYYNNQGEVVQDVRNLIGKQSSYVIKVNRKQCITTVYAKDGKNGYIIPVVAFICSPGTGSNTPVGTFSTLNKYRWHQLYKGVYGQWDTRITGHILFHSVYYTGYNNKNSLSVTAYNRLGSQDSMGCIRLTSGDAKWIYDNCDLRTKVIIYSSSKEEPLRKPKAYKLASWHTWDPTDPTVKSKCKKYGCH